MDYYDYIKALHLIFVITWFAGLFYIPRLFVYQIEASQKPSPEKEILGKQLKLMAKRLWFIITWPSAVLAIVFAFILLILVPEWLHQSWMHLKLGFVVLLIAYHLKCHQIFKQLQNNIVKWTSNQMRLWNEGSTIILFSVIFIVMLRDTLNWVFGLVGLLLLMVILMLGFKIYKRFRKNN
ncbi:MAG TPA: CopD family protein [Flavobacteriaceae bacterium]|nr:CopD family protein [Flavobacteriaceae bacterium]